MKYIYLHIFRTSSFALPRFRQSTASCSCSQYINRMHSINIFLSPFPQHRVLGIIFTNTNNNIKERQFICKCKNFAKQHDATMKRRKSNGPAEQHAQIIAFSSYKPGIELRNGMYTIVGENVYRERDAVLDWAELCLILILMADRTDRG